MMGRVFVAIKRVLLTKLRPGEVVHLTMWCPVVNETRDTQLGGPN